MGVRILLILILITAGLPACTATLTAQDEKAAAAVRTAVATSRDINRSQTFIGSLLPVRRAVIGSAVEDRVARVLVDDGQFVAGPQTGDDGQTAPGQPLVEIDRTTIDIQYQAARIELELWEQTLKELELSIPVEIELAQAKLDQTVAQKSYAESVLQRFEQLGDNATDQELEQARSLFQTQLSAWAAAQAEFRKLESTRGIRLIIARKNVAARQSELERIADLQSRYTIRAPFSGYITAIPVERGNWLTTGTVVTEMVQLDPIEMRVNVPQEYLGNLQKSFAESRNGQSAGVVVRIESLDETFAGTLAGIVPEADERTRTIPAVIRIPNPPADHGHRLYPGLLAEASLNIGRAETAVMVPKDALVLGQSDHVVFRVEQRDGQPVARRVRVTTGPADGTWIAVQGGLSDGDTVVTQGNERLRDGELLKILGKDSEP